MKPRFNIFESLDFGSFHELGHLVQKFGTFAYGLGRRFVIVFRRIHITVDVSRDLVDVMSDMPYLTPDILKFPDDGS